MPIPLTHPCPQCEADMELMTTADDGDVGVYECPECGYQVENEVADDEIDDQISNEPPSDEDQDSHDLPSDDD